MPKLTFSVPWDALCSKNAKYVGKFDKVLSPKYRDAQEKLGLLALVAAKKQKWVRSEKRCRVVAEITEPDRHVRDAYNLGECVLDGLTKCTKDSIWWDDSQGRDVRFYFNEHPDKEKAGAKIFIEEL